MDEQPEVDSFGSSFWICITGGRFLAAMLAPWPTLYSHSECSVYSNFANKQVIVTMSSAITTPNGTAALDRSSLWLAS